jgi:hypothetical protein
MCRLPPRVPAATAGAHSRAARPCCHHEGGCRS